MVITHLWLLLNLLIEMLKAKRIDKPKKDANKEAPKAEEKKQATA
jgi:hypothetical protein